MNTRDLTIILPATERATILAALEAAEAATDKTAAMQLNVHLLAWLRTELTSASVTARVNSLNAVIRQCKRITNHQSQVTNPPKGNR
jgi:hypothetical protein